MEEFFLSALPELNTGKLQEIIQYLAQQGCERYSDLALMNCHQDLSSLLRPYDIRKVQILWNERFASNISGKKYTVLKAVFEILCSCLLLVYWFAVA